MRSGLLSVLLTLSLLTAGATPASALSTYFGQDLGTGPGSFTTSMSAEQDFHDALGAGNFDTEGFESFADKDAGPLSVFQGGLSVSGILSDTVPDAGKVRVAPLDDEVNRGFQDDVRPQRPALQHHVLGRRALVRILCLCVEHGCESDGGPGDGPGARPVGG
jgi:hypothetical protein